MKFVFVKVKNTEEVYDLFFTLMGLLAVKWHFGQSILESFTRKLPSLLHSSW